MTTHANPNRAAKTAVNAALDTARDGDRIKVVGPGWTADIDARRVGPIGVVVDRLKVVGQSGDIAQRASAIAQRIRPHGERLRAVEVAPTLGGAVLATRPEDMRGGRFFQVDLTDDSAELSHQQRHAAAPRQAASFAITRDELDRVVRDLGQILSQD